MQVAFCHHLSLKYGGGGEKWLIQLARELATRGHEVEVYCLPFMLKDGGKLDPVKELGDIPYHEGYFHRVKADCIYITYNPLNWANFWVSGPKIGGMHSHAYWMPLSLGYGLLPNLAILTNAFTSRWELGRFKMIHVITDEYPVTHRDVRCIPNFVDSRIYRPNGRKNGRFTVAFSSRKVWQKGFDIWQETKELMNKQDIDFVESGGLTEQGVSEFLSSSHVVLVPARVDTFGLSIVEAAMCKSIPVVSSLLAHRALGLPLFYADTAECCVRRILEVKEMWESDCYDAYADILYRQALRFDKMVVVDQLEEMFKEVADSG